LLAGDVVGADGADVVVTDVDTLVAEEEREAEGRVTNPEVLLAGGAATDGVTAAEESAAVVADDNCCAEEEDVLVAICVTVTLDDVDTGGVTTATEVLIGVLDVVTAAVVLCNPTEP
jgi:phosphohistidine swiveling domain-containing protein